MIEIGLLKTELAFHGIQVRDDGSCLSFCEGETKPKQSQCFDKIKTIEESVDSNRQLLVAMWKKMRSLISIVSPGTSGGTIVTEKMFAVSLKHLYRFSKRFPASFGHDSFLLHRRLNCDVKKFSESSMSQVIDYKICIEWLFTDIQNEQYCKKLLRAFEQARHGPNRVADGQMTPAGGLDLPMQERVWDWDEDQRDEEDSQDPSNNAGAEHNFNEWDKRIKHQQRYWGLETYNDVNKMEPGRVWREPRNEPYEYGRKEDDPYYHYYNYGGPHRGVDE